MSDKQVANEALTSRLLPYSSKIEEALSRELSHYSNSRFYEPLLYAAEGGKRVRPIILLLSAEALGKQEDALDAAVAVELLHTESIIHDDIIDEETKRRNKVAFHIRYGFSTSLLTADFVFAMVLSIASRYRDRRIAEEISRAALRMAEGEYNELLIDPEETKLEWDTYMKIIEDKTASLFSASSKIGAIIAGGTDEQISLLSDYGRCLGVAYQVRDDMLDWSSREKLTYGLYKMYGEKELFSRMNSTLNAFAQRARYDLSLLPRSEAVKLLEELVNFAVMRKY